MISFTPRSSGPPKESQPVKSYFSAGKELPGLYCSPVWSWTRSLLPVVPVSGGTGTCWSCQGKADFSAVVAKRVWKAWARPDLSDCVPVALGSVLVPFEESWPCQVCSLAVVWVLRCLLPFIVTNSKRGLFRGFFCPPAIPSWSSALEEQPVLFPFSLGAALWGCLETLEWSTWSVFGFHTQSHTESVFPVKYQWVFSGGHRMWSIDLVLCVLFWKVLWALISPRFQGNVGHLDTHRHVGRVAVWTLIYSFWD